MNEGPSGLLLVDKPGGMTSHDVVARARRALGTRKVGHAGTLDPMATGLLVLGAGRATRLLGHLQLADKEYAATIRLGASTTTDDAEGEVLERTALGGLSDAEVHRALTEFVGELDQVPSTVSAIKVDGRRAYARARAGEDVVLAPRRVRVDGIDVRRIALPELEVIVRCSSGTYIRAIARDLGERLGVGGHLSALRRTRIGRDFVVEAACALSRLDEEGQALLEPMQRVATWWPHRIQVDAGVAREVSFGRPLDLPLSADCGDEPVAVVGPDGAFLALYRRAGDRARPVAVFC